MAEKTNGIELCSIVNIQSGNCTEDCAFCSQSSRHESDIPVHDFIPKEKIVGQARILEERGLSCFSLVASGRGPSGKLLGQVMDAVSEIRSVTSLRVCTSLGLLTYGEARDLASAGVNRYHHNLETARSFFPSICGTHSFDDRIETIRRARTAGMEVCSGGIIGMGESAGQREEFFRQLADLEVDSIPLNILNPLNGTRLEGKGVLTESEVLQAIGMARALCREPRIRLCGGRNLYRHEFLVDCIGAGLDALMTGNYLTTSGYGIDRDLELLESRGYSITGKGNPA
jgi:biotin synthase